MQAVLWMQKQVLSSPFIQKIQKQNFNVSFWNDRTRAIGVLSDKSESELLRSFILEFKADIQATKNECPSSSQLSHATAIREKFI
jgi:hypothetical protein